MSALESKQCLWRNNQLALPWAAEMVRANAQGLHGSAKLLTALQHNPSLY